MNREQRRHPTLSIRIKQLIEDMNEIKRFTETIEGDWPIKNGDKVRLNLDVITKHPGYKQKLPAYRKFCEENAGMVFTVEYDKKSRPSVVCLAEDTSKPKWLFWIGDLEKVE